LKAFDIISKDVLNTTNFDWMDAQTCFFELS
jgi:hypothetical protein